MAINIDGILSEVNDLCSADKVSINETIFERYITDESFANHHTVITEVRNGRLIPIMRATQDYGFLKVKPGNCQMNVCDITTTSSTKKWSPVDYNCRLVICKDDLDCDFKKFWDMNCKDYDNMSDAFIEFIVRKTQENVNASQWRIGYFDDENNANPDYAGIDGLFAQYLDIVAVATDQLFNIPENEEATIALQMALADGRALGLIRQMYNWAGQNNPELLTSADAHFDITPELAFNYLASLQNGEGSCCWPGAADGITSSAYSIDNLNYMGIPIRVRSEWRGIIRWQQQQASSANYNDPHRIVLTTKANKPVGTCDDRAFRDFDMFYDKKDKEIIIDVETSFDAKVVLDSDFAIAI